MPVNGPKHPNNTGNDIICTVVLHTFQKEITNARLDIKIWRRVGK